MMDVVGWGELEHIKVNICVHNVVTQPTEVEVG